MSREPRTVIAIVGRGAVGTTLAHALRSAGVAFRVLRGRTRSKPSPKSFADVSLVILAVPDARIAEVGGHISQALARGTAVVHCAGARGADELAALRGHGLAVGAMHPLASFADRKKPPSLEGATFVLSGDRRAITATRNVARLVGAKALVAPLQGPLYHAAAALTANGAVGLAHASVALLESKGASRRDAERAIAGLLRSVAANVESVGVPAALTGPIARGDANTVAWHRDAIGEALPDVLSVYDGVARAILACAIDRGLSAREAASIEAAIGVTPRRRARASRGERRRRVR